MKNIKAFLSYLKELDIDLWVDGDQLHCDAPKGSLTPELTKQLAEHKAELIQLLHTPEVPTIQHISREGELPLSFAQQRLWFIDKLEGKKANPYNIGGALRVEGALNRAVFEQSLSEIVQRHETLHTCFPTVNGRPIVQLLPVSRYQLPVFDLSDLSHEEQTIEIQHLSLKETQRPFDLSKDSLFRASLLRLSAESHILLLTMHHIISDGWSIGVFFQELSVLYNAFYQGKQSPLSALEIQYIDFAHWQRQWLTGETLETQQSYWQLQLAEAPLVLEIPSDHPRPSVYTFQGGYQDFEFAPELTEQLKSLSQQSDATLFMTTLAAFAVLIKRYTGMDEFLIGTGIANRNHKEIEPLIGFFVNTLALRLNLSGNPTFLALLKRVQMVTLEAYVHQELPFEQVVETLQPERDLTRNPLVQVALIFQNAPMPPIELQGMTLNPLNLESNTVRFDLEWHFWEVSGKLMGRCNYYEELFEATTIARMLEHFQTVLAAIVTTPEQPISALTLLNNEERHQLLVEWNQTQTPYPQDQCIHQLFEAQVEKTPEAVAVVFKDQQLTYQELNSRANQLAHTLQTFGVKPEVLVGICVERSLEMVIGLLGILKAGGAYVPLDPSYPLARLAFMLEDSQVSVLLTQHKLRDFINDNLKTAQDSISNRIIFCLDTDWEMISKASSNNPVSGIESDNLAYVIYTSGSTGEPKGVAVTHLAVNRLLFNTNYIQLESDDKVAQISNASFDAATFEIWGALLHGSLLVCVAKEIILSPHDLADLIHEQEISVIFLTTALFNQLADELPSVFQSVRTVLFGGEAVEPKWVAQILQNGPPQRLLHVYGPTENTTFTSWYLVTKVPNEANTIPIGRPIANTQLYILDNHLNPVPIGVPGELLIGGAGLARGYLKRPALTSEKFIPNPFSDKPGAMLYKTGDLVRYLPDGHIEFLGRLDYQVKIRGFRIELDEIQAVLTQHPNVRESVVMVREDQPGNQRLVAYLVSNLIPERIPYQNDCLVKLNNGKTLKLHTEDISNRGVLLGGGITFEKGQKLTLRLRLPGESEARWLPGKVIWTQQTALAGIEFELTHQEQKSLRQSIEYLIENEGLLKVVQRLLTGNLREYLKQKLPDYMVPSNFVLLHTLPLTPNGKIDRRALPVPETAYLPKEDSQPETKIERLIAEVWQQVLHLDQIGIHDNFFELGGHSLLLAQVQAQLQEQLIGKIAMIDLFEYPTIHALGQHISQKQIGIQEASTFKQPPKHQRKKNLRAHQTSNDIAIVGISGRFPQANDLEEFWHNLQEGKEAISFFSDEELMSFGIDQATLSQPNYVKAGAVLSDIEWFDAAFFDITPKEAEFTDPQQRLFLEGAWEALEQAGYEAGTDDHRIGVYAGVGMNGYLLNNLYPNKELFSKVGGFQLMIENDKDFLTTRVSYKLNLTGPSINVQTACSTSLVAVHLACQSLLEGECDIALAGGVTVHIPQKSGYWYVEGMINSPDGHCRAFDADAQGTVSGSGMGIVVLRKLEDAIASGDCIHAIIKGSALNNDGSLKVGYTAPSVEGQAAVIADAQAVAGIEADSITYVETHGTGTALGDPIEIAALTKAFLATTQKQGFCAIGSLKTNIGHTDAAAGVAGLIKTVLALKHQLIPPSLHFKQPNPQIDFTNSPFYVNTKPAPWTKLDGNPRRAGVSSFGIGGTNAHVILEEAPSLEESSQSRPWQLLLLSAKTESALETATSHLAAYLEQHPNINLADVAYTLKKGRKAFSHRRMLVCQTIDQATAALRTVDSAGVLTQFQKPTVRPVVFMFTGQGSQYVNMGLELYQTEPIFRAQVVRCSEYLKPLLGLDLRQVLYPKLSSQHAPSPYQEENEENQAENRLKQTAITQPALFVIEYALAKLWMAWGVQPEAMIGHSIGEYVAACLANVFSVEEALSLVAARGQMMQQMPKGAMLSIPLPEAKVLPLLGQGISLAAINAPSLCVVSGSTAAIDALQTQLTEQGVEVRRLHTSHAFHSQMMNPILGSFTERVKQIRLCAPTIPFVSNVTGTWITKEDATNPNYWASHLRQTVRFADGLQPLLEEPARILIEIGPGRTLTTLARRHPNKVAEQVILNSLRPPQEQQSDAALLLNRLGQFWLADGQLNWSEFYAAERRHRLPLPTYPFERQRYWVVPPTVTTLQSQLPPLWPSVSAAAHQAAQLGISALDNPTYLAKKAVLDRLCVAYMGKALKDLGAFSQPDDQYSVEAFSTQFSVIPSYQQLLSRWQQVLLEQGQLQQSGNQIAHLTTLTTDEFRALLTETQQKWADEPEWLGRVQRCGEQLAAALTGKTSALLLLSQDTNDTNTPDVSMVQDSPLMQYYTDIMRATVQSVVNSLPPSATLKILELGGGSGYATSAILPVLPAQRTQYIFTDISRLLLEFAKQKFSDYPFVQYRLLDIEQSPVEQGYEPHSFDILIAVNVLHVTRHIAETLEHARSLLAPSGLLLIWEVTQPQLDFDITDALLMNPLEENERNQGNPFLSTAQWHLALRKLGFVEITAVPKTEVLGHHILVAQADSSGARTAFSPKYSDRLEQQLSPANRSLGKKPNIADWFYIPTWEQSVFSGSNQNSLNSVGASVLVFDHAGSLCDRLVQELEHQGSDVIRVQIGAQFAKLNDQVYTLNPQQAEDYESLLKHIPYLNTIVHFWTLTADECQEVYSRLEVLDKEQHLGFYSLLFLAQAFGKQNRTDDIQIAVVSNYLHAVTGADRLCPDKATVLGPIRSIPQEYQHIKCRSIDVTLPEFGSRQMEEQLIVQLMLELAYPTSDQMIAYRDQERWVQRFEPVPLEHPLQKSSYRLREGGVYLITGGLGGIGLVLAEHLAKTVQAKLILTGRSDFPNRDDWPQWLSTHEDQDRVSQKILKIQEIEQLGSEVWIVCVDVAILECMQDVIMMAKARLGTIHGVIHAAGVYPEGSIQLKTQEQVEDIMAPKVWGTVTLDTVLKEFELDFLVLCSSLSSILGGIVEHCGANAFLDAFAHYKTYQQNQFTVSINWDGWQEVGQAAEAAKRQYGMAALAQTPQLKEVAHPLFDHSWLEGNQEIYLTHFSVQKHWVVDEHRVMGQPTLPGTAYLEMARAAFENHANEAVAVELREVYFLTPLFVSEDGETEVRTILTPREKGFEFVIESQSAAGEGQWVEHAKGNIFRLEAEAPIHYNFQQLEAGCQEQKITLSGTDELNVPERFVKVGPRWNTLKQVQFGNNQGLALLALPEIFAADINTYKLHPALLDGATAFASHAYQGAYLPFSYKQLKIKGPLPAKLYSYITADDKNTSDSDTLKFNITIMDEQGNGVVEIEDYTLRRIEVEQPDDSQKTPIFSDSQNFCLEIATPGILDSLTLRPAPRRQPGPGEVEIEVYAAGLNFKEVLIALGMIPIPSEISIKFGYECAGKIVALGEDVEEFQLGDEVIALAPASFSALTITEAASVVHKPDNLTFEEAATIPVAFATAYYALITLGRLSNGERILIHAAAGGVGMAAVKIAQWVGAEIFATAGNPEKRAFLHSLGIQYVMDSRTLAFADEVMKYTEGKGVDVVMNSLVGEFIPKSLDTLAPFGRFLELGIRDIYNNTQLGLRPFEKGLSYLALGAVGAGQDTPTNSKLRLGAPEFKELIQYFKDGKLTPLPYRVFPLTEVTSAFEYMAQAKHIGKVVVSVQDQNIIKPVSKGTMVRHQSTQQSKAPMLPQGPVVTNIFQKDFNEYLLPSEGVEVFSRILAATSRPQFLVSTMDLPSRLQQGSFSNVLTELKKSEQQPSLYQSAHPRPQLSQAYVAPRNTLEQQVADIWQQFLGIEPVGVYDDFFELGGDSLAAVQLIAQLRETLKMELSPHSLLNSPNIAALVEGLEPTSVSTGSSQSESTEQGASSSLLVEIKTGSHLKPPLFLIHPIGGHVYLYRDLANQLEQSVYGIQAQGLYGEAEPLTRIEEMATVYIEALQAVQPEGPYFLGGSSLGGMLAFEMAQQLNEQGQSIGLLFMADSPGPGQMPVTLETDIEILAYLLKVGANIPVSLDELRQLEPEEQLRFFLETQRKMSNQMIPDWNISQIRHFLHIHKLNAQAMWDYQPGIYQGKIIFFHAQEKDAYNATNPEQAWIDLAAEGLDVIEVPGNHITMNLPPHVQIFAERLKAYLP